MEKIQVTEKRKDRILTATLINSFKVVDQRGNELKDWEYKSFIDAMFSGNPNANLAALYKKVRERTRREVGVGNG